MVHVENLTLAVLSIVRAQVGGAFFVCDPEPFDFKRLPEAIRSASGKQVRLLVLPSVVFRCLKACAPRLFRSMHVLLVCSAVCMREVSSGPTTSFHCPPATSFL
jgi:hypothetical protein